MSYDSDCYCDNLEFDEVMCVFCEMNAGWRLSTLGKNLVMAGALQLAYECADVCAGEPWWRPGLGKPVPGWGSNGG